MKTVIVLVLTFAAGSWQAMIPAHIPILKYDAQYTMPQGTYSYSYETGNGIAVHESGSPKTPDILAVRGGYSYTSPEGVPVNVMYTADENGFIASDSRIRPNPTPVPIPTAILTSAVAYEEQRPQELTVASLQQQSYEEQPQGVTVDALHQQSYEEQPQGVAVDALHQQSYEEQPQEETDGLQQQRISRKATPALSAPKSFEMSPEKINIDLGIEGADQQVVKMEMKAHEKKEMMMLLEAMMEELKNGSGEAATKAPTAAADASADSATTKLTATPPFNCSASANM